MSNPDDYETMAPLTPLETLERLGALETAKEAHEHELEGLKRETSEVKGQIEAIGERESMLIRARRDGRTLFALKDGGYTFDAPKMPEPTLPFATAPASDGAGSPAGKILSSPFAARRFTATRQLPESGGTEAAEIRQERDGKWWARCGGRPYALGLETREAAQAELEKEVGPLEWTAVVEEAAPAERGPFAPSCYRATYKGRRLSVTLEKFVGSDDAMGWRPRCATGDDVENAPEEWTTGEEGRSVAMQRCLDLAGFDSADPRPEWTPDVPERGAFATVTMPPAPFPEKDEGAIYGADLPDGRHASVGQSSRGAPWSAWIGTARVGELNGYPTSAGARTAVELSASEGEPLVPSLRWRFELTPDEADHPAAPPPADSPAAAPNPETPAPGGEGGPS